MTSKTATTIHSLAPELHHQILDALSSFSSTRNYAQVSHDLLASSLVCRDWREYSLKLLWRSVTLDSPRKLQSFRMWKGKVGYRTDHLVLKGLSSQDKNGWHRALAVREVISACPELSSLELADIGLWPWCDPNEEVKHVLHLKSLRLSDNLSVLDHRCTGNPFHSLDHLFVSANVPSYALRLVTSEFPSPLSHLELGSLASVESTSTSADPPQIYQYRASLRHFLPTISTLTLHFDSPNSEMVAVLATKRLVEECLALSRLNFFFDPSMGAGGCLRCFRLVIFGVGTKLASLGLKFCTTPPPSILTTLHAMIMSTSSFSEVSACEMLQVIEFDCRKEQLLEIGIREEEDQTDGSDFVRDAAQAGIRLEFSL